MVRILLADDHDVVRRGLRDQLSKHEGWEICGEASDGREAVRLALKLAPDVAVIDLSMPELNGLEATRQIRAECGDLQTALRLLHAPLLRREQLLESAAKDEAPGDER